MVAIAVGTGTSMPAMMDIADEDSAGADLIFFAPSFADLGATLIEAFNTVGVFAPPQRRCSPPPSPLGIDPPLRLTLAYAHGRGRGPRARSSICRSHPRLRPHSLHRRILSPRACPSQCMPPLDPNAIVIDQHSIVTIQSCKAQHTARSIQTGGCAVGTPLRPPRAAQHFTPLGGGGGGEAPGEARGSLIRLPPACSVRRFVCC